MYEGPQTLRLAKDNPYPFKRNVEMGYSVKVAISFFLLLDRFHKLNLVCVTTLCACMCVCVLIAVDRTRADTFYCLMYTVQRKCSEDLEVVVVSP